MYVDGVQGVGRAMYGEGAPRALPTKYPTMALFDAIWPYIALFEP